MRRAKIVATLGPATSSYEQIKGIVDAGVNVARMNLSHGSYDVHEAVYKNVRQVAADTGKAVAVLVDLQGPKIRLARFKDGPVMLEKGATLRVEVDLPRLGRLRIVGSQWGRDLSLHIAHASDAQGDWVALAPELMQDLRGRGVHEVRVDSLSEEVLRG